MARKRTSTFEDLVTILSRLPWWASLLIGVISWLILRPVATSPMATPPSATLDDLSGIMLSQAWRVFAMFGQYLIPLICLFGAISLVAGRHRSKKLLKKVKFIARKVIHDFRWECSNFLLGSPFAKRATALLNHAVTSRKQLRVREGLNNR